MDSTRLWLLLNQMRKKEKKTEKQKSTTGLRTCNNILAMTQPLRVKSPFFIGDKRINLSWKEATKSSASSAGYGRFLLSKNFLVLMAFLCCLLPITLSHN